MPLRKLWSPRTADKAGEEDEAEAGGADAQEVQVSLGLAAEGAPVGDAGAERESVLPTPTLATRVERRELQLLAEQLERRAALLAEREAMQGSVEAGALSRAKAEALRQLGAAQQVVSRRALAAKRLALLGQCWRALVLHKMASQLLTDRRHFRQLLQQPAGTAGTAAGAVDDPVTPLSLRLRRSVADLDDLDDIQLTWSSRSNELAV